MLRIHVEDFRHDDVDVIRHLLTGGRTVRPKAVILVDEIIHVDHGVSLIELLTRLGIEDLPDVADRNRVIVSMEVVLRLDIHRSSFGLPS